MATLKATILQNFATVGIPDFEEEESLAKTCWSIVGLSENLIGEERLVGLSHLNTRRLDLVIHNGSKFALLNLQAFKIFECELATNTIRQCVAHYLTPDGNLLFGVQTSGDVIVLTDGLQSVKNVRKPAFIKLQQRQPKWYEDIPGKIAEFFGGGKSKTNQVSPEATLRGVYISSGPSVLSAPSAAWWQTGVGAAISSDSSSVLPENVKGQFPYLTSLLDGLAILCAFSPTDCYIFLSSYETALRAKSIANIKGNDVPGRWFRIIMHKSFIAKWLEDRRTAPTFEARLCYRNAVMGEPAVVSGALLYGVMENLRLELVYGIIKKRADKFTLSWEMLQFDVDWALRESDQKPYNLGSTFVAKLSGDCSKIVIAISNHLGMYIHVQDITSFADEPIHLNRQKVCLCNHSDYDGCHFYKQDCWIADVQWLVEDAYFAVMTLCGSLSIFYNSGEPMIVKVRKPGPEFDDNKSARFYFPVFHPHQIVTPMQSQHQQEEQRQRHGEPPVDDNDRVLAPSPQVYPTIKWIDSEQVLTCSSGMKIELFSIQRVVPIKLEEGQSRIWLGEGSTIDLNGCHSRRRLSLVKVHQGEHGNEYGTSSHSSLVSSRPSKNLTTPSIPEVKLDLGPSNSNNVSRNNMEQIIPVKEYRYSREEDEFANNDYNPEYEIDIEENDDGDDEVEMYQITDVDTPSHIEELPPDGGEIVEENLESVRVDANPTPEKLRGMNDDQHSKKSVIFLAPKVSMLSLPESIVQMDVYEEISDGSSEPDLGEQCDLAVPLEEVYSNPDVELSNTPPTQSKRSQHYMADDEADEEEVVLGIDNFRRTLKRKSTGKSTHSFNSRVRTPPELGMVSTPEEESDHLPQSSSANDTEFSKETYSSPFSYTPTTAEGNEEEFEQEGFTAELFPVVEVEAQNAFLDALARSRSSTVSLQMPPVPKISGVIVPSERQSDMLMQNIVIPSPTMQPELMRYKPPPSTVIPSEPCSVDVLHFKSKSAGIVETMGRNMSPPHEGVADYYNFEEEEEDQEVTTETAFASCDQPCRYRNSSV